MPNGSLMEMMGYEVGGLPELFGQYFEDVDPRWTEMFDPQFKTTRTALGELPGLRRGMEAQVGQRYGLGISALQQRGIQAGRGIQARRAGAGFAGAGALDVMGRQARRGLGMEQAGLWAERGRGMYGIGQDIARKRAGLLGGLRGRIGSFLEMLMAAGVEAPVEDVDDGDGDGYRGLVKSDPPGYGEVTSTGAPSYQGGSIWETVTNDFGTWRWDGDNWFKLDETLITDREPKPWPGREEPKLRPHFA